MHVQLVIRTSQHQHPVIPTGWSPEISAVLRRVTTAAIRGVLRVDPLDLVRTAGHANIHGERRLEIHQVSATRIGQAESVGLAIDHRNKIRTWRGALPWKRRHGVPDALHDIVARLTAMRRVHAPTKSSR